LASYISAARSVCIIVAVKRIQIHMDEKLDEAAETEAARRGISKAALIRASLAHELQTDSVKSSDPWESISGWLDDDPVENIDEAVYGHASEIR